MVEVELHYFLTRELERSTSTIDEMVDTFIVRDGKPLLSDSRLLPGEDIEQIPDGISRTTEACGGYFGRPLRSVDEGPRRPCPGVVRW